jgi:pyridoxal phosphate enzyme (YggS family)
MIPLEYIGRNLAAVQERIAAACRRAGRDPSEVTLVAVSKTVGAAEVLAAYRAGVRHFGENRVEEALPKIAEVAGLLRGAPVPTWHMIGHLQRRKVRDAMPAFALVHSVDSVDLAREIDKRCEPLGKVMPILLEVNVSGEASKYGFAPADAPAAVEQILTLPRLELRGLMTMAPIVPAPEAARPYFRALRQLRDDLARRYPAVAWRELSMGMTDDFEPAVEEGATLVRIGRAIFNPA